MQYRKGLLHLQKHDAMNVIVPKSMQLHMAPELNGESLICTYSVVHAHVILGCFL